jgi:hypothetical protein
MIDYAQLNHHLSAEADGLSDAWRRVLGRLGEYTRLIVRGLNLRPTAATVLGQTNDAVLVRLTTRGEHLVVRIAPEADLSGAVYFARALAAQSLPATPLISADLSRTLGPFAYTVERYVCGVPATHITEQHVLRAAARQAGRVLRRAHRIAAPGWGRPGSLGRWATPGWTHMLKQLNQHYAPPPVDVLVFNEEERSAVQNVLSDTRLLLGQARLMHGNFGPHAARFTLGGDTVQIEALVEPGILVGGDPLLDLASGLNPAYPADWRDGLYEGYMALGALNEHERARLPLLEALSCYWSACRRYMYAEPHEAARERACALLEELVMNNVEDDRSSLLNGSPEHRP